MIKGVLSAMRENLRGIDLHKNHCMRLKEFPGYMLFLIGNTVIYTLKVAERILDPLGIKVV